MLGTSVSDLDQGAGKNITNGKYYKRAFVNWKIYCIFKNMAPSGIYQTKLLLFPIRHFLTIQNYLILLGLKRLEPDPYSDFRLYSDPYKTTKSPRTETLSGAYE